MIKGKDIIVVGLQPWDIKIGSNCKNIAAELSKYNRVLYVNAPLDWNTRLKGRKDPAVKKRLDLIASGKNLVVVQDNLWNLYPGGTIFSVNWLGSHGLFSRINRRNNERFARDIRAAAASLGFKDIILFNDSDMLRSFWMKELLQPVVSVYYSRDNLMATPYFYKHGHILEPQLMAKSDLVCANSTYLADIARQYNPQSFYVGQGCDLSVFDPDRVWEKPEEMKDIPGPVIGYIGAIISNRLDLPLMEELTERKPEWSFVFVGKYDEAFGASPLMKRSNVYFLGLKPEVRLPEFLAAFDVAINPQAINDMTIGNYPRKIDEYLAMGKPAVASETKTMEIFREYVYLGRTAEDYVRLIGEALEDKDEERARARMAFARTHTWENSVEAISDAIERVRPDLG